MPQPKSTAKAYIKPSGGLQLDFSYIRKEYRNAYELMWRVAGSDHEGIKQMWRDGKVYEANYMRCHELRINFYWDPLNMASLLSKSQEIMKDFIEMENIDPYVKYANETFNTLLKEIDKRNDLPEVLIIDNIFTNYFVRFTREDLLNAKFNLLCAQMEQSIKNGTQDKLSYSSADRKYIREVVENMIKNAQTPKDLKEIREKYVDTPLVSNRGRWSRFLSWIGIADSTKGILEKAINNRGIEIEVQQKGQTSLANNDLKGAESSSTQQRDLHVRPEEATGLTSSSETPESNPPEIKGPS